MSFLLLFYAHSLNPEGLNVYRNSSCSEGAIPSGAECLLAIPVL